MNSVFMKIFVVFLFVFSLAEANFSQTLGCGYPSVSDNRGTYYMSCFNRASGQTTDYERIQFAINYIPGGKLIFDKTPDGNPYTVSQAVNLHSNLILEGTSSGTTIVPSSSAIRLNASSNSTSPKSIFKIGELVYDVAIRDLGLYAENATHDTIGILAEGTHITNTSTASLNFEFSNIRFTNFTTAIKVNALDSIHSWQFDNVKLEHCVFEGCKIGVHINSFNSGWQMNSIEFFAAANAIGVFIEKGTYTTIDSMIGNGAKPGLSDTFIKIKDTAASVTIRNCISEEFANDLDVDSAGLTSPITLTANTFQGQVTLKNVDVFSSGNHFGISVGTGSNRYEAPQPKAKGGSHVTSIGDKFCSDGAANCLSGGYILQDNAYIVFSSDINQNIINRPTYMGNLLSIITDLPYASEVNEPLLTLIRPTLNNLPLLRLGTGNNHYTLSRNDFGYLKFQGTQSPPYRGYNFDGPVKLPSYIVTTLPYILESGSMVYCSNCQAGTSPCAAAGSGGQGFPIKIERSINTPTLPPEIV